VPPEVGQRGPLEEDVRLRAGRPEDAARLAVVFVAAWRHSYDGVVSKALLGALDENEIAAWLRTLIGGGDSTTTVAESADSELHGFCRHGVDPDDAGRGHVFSLYVAPTASGRGIGTCLLAHALEDLERNRLDPVTLWVFAKNTAARRFYAAFGFLADGARRVEPKYGAEEVRLCRGADKSSCT